jgi:hypothetical protein
MSLSLRYPRIIEAPHVDKSIQPFNGDPYTKRHRIHDRKPEPSVKYTIGSKEGVDPIHFCEIGRHETHGKLHSEWRMLGTSGLVLQVQSQYHWLIYVPIFGILSLIHQDS